LRLNVTAGGAAVHEGSPLKIQLGCWQGKCSHMLLLLKAFPDTLFIGMNASVGFAKSTRAHECAFEVPLNRLILETDAPHATPAPVAAALGRAAFCHSGLIPFVAAAIAEHKVGAVSPVGDAGGGTISAADVARAASENTARLYGGGVAARAAEAAEAAAAAAAAAEVARIALAAALAEEQEADAADGAVAAVAMLKLAKDEEVHSATKKKKTKKKGRPDITATAGELEHSGGSGGGGGDANFDNDFFTNVNAGAVGDEDAVPL
jgi:hypothetical protein